MTRNRGLPAYVRKALTVAELEARKMRRDPTELLTRAIQPALWLLVFGTVMAGIRAPPAGYASYLDFLAPGILAQSVLFVAIFYGIAVIWERDLGLLQKFLASPTPRSAIVLGKGLSAGVRSLTQVLLVFVLAALLSVLLASLVKTRERFLGIGQILTFPLFFASNAVYEVSAMPPWLRAVAAANPLTYLVDALRHLMLAGDLDAAAVAKDAVVLTLATALAVWVAGRTYAKTVTQ